MKTLDDAWRWYLSLKGNLRNYRRIATHHWKALTVEDGPLARDQQLRELLSSEMVEETDFVLNELNDLAVFVLFSVFENLVRANILEEANSELTQLTHPTLRGFAKRAVVGIEEGSFYNHILDPMKEMVTSDLVEKVNQVRKYRNWVAHGRRSEPPDHVTPEVAYTRLTDFLQALRPSGE